MSIQRLALLGVLIAATLATPAWAKGITAEIIVTGEPLPRALSITDPEVCGQFSVWSGPNSRYRVRGGDWQTDYSGIFIDFPGGRTTSIPEDLQVFDVEFRIARSPGEPIWDETYRVQYAIDPDVPGGYMYLPRGNPFIHHGVEGNWFRSTESWELAVRPLILERLE